MSLLRFYQAACLRGDRLLFKGVDFALGPGDALIVTGPNGVGKSSLLRMAAGLLAPFSGKVERAGKLALADETPAMDERQPLAAALRFWARLDGSDAAPAMAALGLEALARVPVRMLSTGQRKRAVLARVMASQAPLWLLDEPANGLDGDGLRLLADAIAAHRAAGGAVLAASHQPLAAEGAASMVLKPA